MISRIGLKERITLMLNVDSGTKDSRGAVIYNQTVVGVLPAHVGYLSTKMGQSTGWPVTQLLVTIPHVDFKATSNKTSSAGNWLRWGTKDLLANGDALIRSLHGRPHHLVIPVKMA